MASDTNRKIPIRSLVLIIMCMVLWAVLVGRLFYLQIISHERYKVGAIDNIQRETAVSAQRGIIYDRNGVQLATNMTVWRIFVSPRDVKDASQGEIIAYGLSDILGVDINTIYEKLSYTSRADMTIKKNVEEEEANLVLEFIEQNGLHSQVHLEATTKRYYPYGKLASHVIGFMGTDGGLLGLEYQYNTELTGTVGRYITAKNASGERMPFKYDSYIEAENGANLMTTIDLTTQSLLEEQLEKTYHESMAANRVTGIVMDVNTGGVLAMATYPDFDLNSPYVLDEDSQVKLDTSGFVNGTNDYTNYYYELLYTMWRNKAVSEVYEPGSTSKVITTAMALEEDLVELDEKFDCTGAHYVEGYGKAIHCHRVYGHGKGITFQYGLQQSCNPVLMTIAARIGRDKFYDYYMAFGYTEKTGIDLPGEASPIFHNFNSFNQVELAVYSFGQTYKVSPIQQITAISAVANGGKLVTPHLVSALTDDEGNVIKSYDAEIKRQVVSEEVCKTLAAVLEDGVSGDGGAKNAYVAGYKVAAKTGTSEIRDILDENGESYLRIGSTVAYAPADDPQIAALIVVDQPMCENVYGSVVAAPYISDLLDEVLPNFGIERQYTAEEAARQNVTLLNYVGWPLQDAMANITAWGIKYKIVGELTGDGDVVTFQMPVAGNMVSKENGKVILYTGNAAVDDYEEVPNLIGMTAQIATNSLMRRGFNIVIEGTQNYDVGTGAVVVSQEPAAGESALYGSVVTVVMRYLDGTAN